MEMQLEEEDVEQQQRQENWALKEIFVRFKTVSKSILLVVSGKEVVKSYFRTDGLENFIK